MSSPSAPPTPTTSASSSTESNRGRVHKRTRKRKIQPPKVRQLLRTVMEKAATSGPGGAAVDPNHNEFFSTGRVGRRNAMPDIMGQHCRTTTADLPDQLSALSTGDSSCAITAASAVEPVAGSSQSPVSDGKQVDAAEQQLGR